MPSYPFWVRLTHWLTVFAVLALLTSGLEIFNAHPTLYAADASDPARIVLTLPGPPDDGGAGNQMTLFGHVVGTGKVAMPTFPEGLALGGWLEGGRRIHFASAWVFGLAGVLYLGLMLATRRLRFVWPRGADLKDIGPAIRDHLRIPPVLHGPNGTLNPLQKISYFAVPVLLAPFLVATGLALSPQWDALFPWWTDLFGGRQFARTWHFAAMLGLLGFIVVHLVMVALSGPRIWAKMITGGRKDA